MDNFSADELKKCISKVFLKVKAPPIDEIVVDNDWDTKAIKSDFSFFLSHRVEPALLEYHAKSLPALTPEAFVFFLKYYLLYSLENPNTELSEYLIYLLSSMKSDDFFWKERLLLLMPEQKKAVANFCILLKDILPPNEKVLCEFLAKAEKQWCELSNITNGFRF